MSKIYATPGVYIEEKSAFPNSAVPVATAVPAFIGYTEKAILNKKDITNVPTRISSFGEYQLYFGGGPTSTYFLDKDPNPNKIYALKPNEGRFLLFNCMKMFFANGGSDCYIVSIGDYKSTINPDHFDNELPATADEEGKLIGIRALLKEAEPTMLVIPDAVLLPKDDCYSLQQKMLLHCGMDMRNRVAILDIYEGFKKRTPDDSDVVTSFRENIGSNHLQWGTVYYPWVHTTITSAESLDFTNIDKESNDNLISILSAEVNAAIKEGILEFKRGNAMLEAFENIRKYNSKPLSTTEASRIKGETANAVNGAAGEEISAAAQLTAAKTPEEIKEKKKELEEKKAAHSMAKVKDDIAKVAGLVAAKAEAEGALKDAIDSLKEKKETLEDQTKNKTAPRTAAAAGTLIGDIKKLIEALVPLVKAEETAKAADPVVPANVKSTGDEVIKQKGKITEKAKEGPVASADIEALITLVTNAAATPKPPDADKNVTAKVTELTEKATIVLVTQEEIDELQNGIPAKETAVKEAVKNFEKVIKDGEIKTHHQTLLAVSPLYKSIMASLREQINLLPPSAGMAGVYSMVDNTVGVFQSPANVSMGTVIRPAVNLTNDEQEDLNMPLSGKAVNAIRTFPGKGVLVWGARTLDGNSQDWRYVSVRRTVIFIEQSIKYAAEPYVFAPNTATTWSNMKAMLTNFLTNIWQQGALAGATPEDAFSINIGLGETMTPVDILDGILRITIKIAVTRPAEFIVITFEQQMQKS
jgi:uncharacterized protein